MRPAIISVLSLIVLGGLVTLGHAYVSRGQRVVQPILFNHAVHVVQAAIECEQCHADASTRRFAGLPGKDACLDCHDIDDESGSHPEKDALFAYDESDADIPWVRVAVTRPDVFFSHRRHVAVGGLSCLDCHPNQAELRQPPPARQRVMSMSTCLDCHSDRGVTADCLACHR